MNKSRTTSGILVVPGHARIPLHRQIETSSRDSIRAGRPARGSAGSATPGPGGLIFGYATVSEQAIAEAPAF